MGEVSKLLQDGLAGREQDGAHSVTTEDLQCSKLLDWNPNFVPRTPERRLPPLSRAEVERHAESVGVTWAGVEYLVSAIDSPPARKVGNAHGINRIGERHGYVQGSFMSPDSEARVQTESDGELAFAEIVSSNPSTWILLDQPISVTLVCTDSIGRRQPRKYTPDFLLVMSDRVLVVEVKPLQALLREFRRRPDLWSFRNGNFAFTPAASHFNALGIDYEIVPTETIPWILARNLALLEAIPYPSTEAENARVKAVQRAITRQQPASIEDLISRCDLDSGVPVLQSILVQRAYVDLSRCCLWEPGSSTICSTLDRATKIGVAIEQRDLVLQKGHGDAEQLFDPRYFEAIGFRHAAITGQIKKLFPGAEEVSERTIQRWKKSFQEGGLAGLAPKSRNAGRPRLISDANTEIAIRQIALDRSSGIGTSIEQSYVRYSVTLEEMGPSVHRPHQMSKASYRRLWRARDHNRVDAQRAGGKRAGNADAGRVATEDQAPLATLPLQVAQVDHCTLPVACEEKGDAILSMLVDQVTEEVLAWVILFSAPSSTTVCLLLRDCVRRHGRLPRTVYADGGSDFRGDAFQLGLWDFRIGYFQRGAANPKSGSQIERMHELLQKAAIRGATGFKMDVKRSRAVSASHSFEARRKQLRSRVLAKVSLAIGLVNKGAARKDAPSPAGIRSDLELVYGSQGILVEQDLKFFVATSPFVDIGGYTDSRGAIRWDQRYFTATNLISKSTSVRQLSPRLDPESGGNVIYFYLDGTWHRAIDRKHALRAGISNELLSGTAVFTPKRDADRGIRPMHRAMEMEQRNYDQAAQSGDVAMLKASPGQSVANPRSSERPGNVEPFSSQASRACNCAPSSPCSCVDDGWDSIEAAPTDQAADAP